MAYGSGDTLGMSIFANELNGCPYIQVERIATIDLRPFVGSHPRHSMTRLASLPKVASSPLT